MIDGRPWWKQRVNFKVNRSDDIVNATAGKAVQQRPAVVELSD
jgi:hypothetical protein